MFCKKGGTREGRDEWLVERESERTCYTMCLTVIMKRREGASWEGKRNNATRQEWMRIEGMVVDEKFRENE